MRKAINQDKKSVTEIKDKIAVNSQTSNLVVITERNELDGTFKIKTHITTKQVDFKNEDITAATLKNLHNLMTQATEDAIEWALEWRASNQVDDGQMEIGEQAKQK